MPNNDNNKKEYSQEEGNLEIVKINKNNNAIAVDNCAPGVKRSGNIIIGTLNVFTCPFKKRHAKYYKESTFHLVADIILALIIFGLIGILCWLVFFEPGQKMLLESKYLSDKITSGQMETFEIKYINKSQEEYQNTSLAVIMPENFILDSVSPENVFDNNTNTFHLGNLTAGGNGKVKIKGIILGDLGSQQTLAYIFNYYYKGSQENVINSLIYNIEDSALDVKLILPNRIFQGVEFFGNIDLSLNSDINFEEIKLEFSDNLEIISGEAVKKDNDILINEIKPGEKKQISFKAMANRGGPQDFELTASALFNNKNLKQSLIKEKRDIQKSKFIVSINTDQEIIKDKEAVNYVVSFINDETEKISNVNFYFVSGNNNYRLGNFNITYPGSCDITAEKFTASKTELSPGESERIELSASFINYKRDFNQEVYLSAVVSYEINGEKLKKVIYSPKVKILSNLNVSAAGYYYSREGDQLGVGPLPPTVDMLTNYWIFFDIGNFGNDLEDINIVAQLGKDVIWGDDKSLLAGELYFGQESGRIVWNINTFGKNESNKKAGFKIGIIPKSNDIGKISTLLENIEYSAYDKFCNKKISGSLSDITTDLVMDKLASGKSKVISRPLTD